jgi:hypothetical protein
MRKCYQDPNLKYPILPSPIPLFSPSQRHRLAAQIPHRSSAGQQPILADFGAVKHLRVLSPASFPSPLSGASSDSLESFYFIVELAIHRHPTPSPPPVTPRHHHMRNSSTPIKRMSSPHSAARRTILHYRRRSPEPRHHSFPMPPSPERSSEP